MASDCPVLVRLMDVIQERRRRQPPGSYTVQLLRGGTQAIGAKVLEEAGELVEAAGGADPRQRRGAVRHEAADLVYHLLVLLGYCEVRWEEVEAELEGRMAGSGSPANHRPTTGPSDPKSSS